MGLSPRVRGNQDRLLVAPGLDGSIPACAGEPRQARGDDGIAAVYPRVCGGTLLAANVHAQIKGLSPRVRGNLHRPDEYRHHPGSIPACAGEPAGQRIRRRRSGVYPRVCGGTFLANQPTIGTQGLSPRVRGNLHRPDEYRHHPGSIPACAGEPSTSRSCRLASRVYPRVCGGTRQGRGGGVEKQGLSPRVRGNPCWLTSSPFTRRSIPACAGEPATESEASHKRRVYPRVCGGTAPKAKTPQFEPGLSPRVRGNLDAAAAPGLRWGSIPACAGEPSTRPNKHRPRGVYPRVCGGTFADPRHLWPEWGLSPRVRGNRYWKLLPQLSPGSIPACAGEPQKQVNG